MPAPTLHLFGGPNGCGKTTFALESTLSGRAYVAMLREARQVGYHVRLNYMWLPSADLSVRRVQRRVRMGGHIVPDADIRRRYERSILHLIEDYLPLADEWWIWDNEQNPPVLLASWKTHAIDSLRNLLVHP